MWSEEEREGDDGVFFYQTILCGIYGKQQLEIGETTYYPCFVLFGWCETVCQNVCVWSYESQLLFGILVVKVQ